MDQPRITFVINGNTYSLGADDPVSIRNVPAHDRRYLINLLEAIKKQDSVSLGEASKALNQSRNSSVTSPTARLTAASMSSNETVSSRMGSGDIDAMMARLAVEEKRNRKQGLTKAGIYKVMGGFLLLIFLLVVIL